MKISSLFKKVFSAGKHVDGSYKRLLAAECAEHVRIRRGFVPFYVGEEERRFEVPVEYLSFPPLIEELHKLAEDEVYDIKTNGPIKLPRTTSKKFEEILELAKKVLSGS